MKKLILASTLLIMTGGAWAKPSSQVAWTADQLNFVKAGDPAKGKESAKVCSGCHGENGVSSMPNTPSLAGLMPTYIYKQLIDYNLGDRQDPMMAGIAKSLSKQDAADLAAWFASLPKALKSTDAKLEQAEKLVKHGNSERVLPPCEVCHGGKGQGQDIPALAGQNADYISTTLNAFKSGNRHNDIYGRMRTIAGSLSDQEIKELGVYYQNLQK